MVHKTVTKRALEPEYNSKPVEDHVSHADIQEDDGGSGECMNTSAHDAAYLYERVETRRRTLGASRLNVRNLLGREVSYRVC